ncbi:UpxY family transcription antiterminator [Fulvivirga ulvae]|uniref:transcription termination/antitermination protein NusG n=1 Tax=Fulvivirga ulvae TaxID=2904245 RepID=UPI001F25DD98|nr:UpxY family transcription antiterminator [Fulvivirga ulvae]UII33630.1 UpxY family transcription antiterminator [Fulvivirga ulvae]
MSYSNAWYVLYVKSRFEKKVADSLEEISLKSFLPLVRTVRRWSDRKKTIMQPLFPSYVFVNVNSQNEFHRALSVNGACGYIRFGVEYAQVSDKEIKQIKYLVGDKNIIDIEANVDVPEVGEVKKIMNGPLRGLECKVLEAENLNKIIVRIDSLQQNIKATVPSYVFSPC